MTTPKFPIEKECHCGTTADMYFKRTFTCKSGFKVFRVFYKCRNCKSRIHDDLIPEIDQMNRVDVSDLLVILKPTAK